MKCSRCGLKSEVEQAFTTKKDFFKKPTHYCPDCNAKHSAESLILSYGILAGLGLFFYLVKPDSWSVALIIQTTLAVFSIIPLIFIHELAHALVARLMGLRVFGVFIGIGKTLWMGRFLGANWTVNTVPVGGITMVGARSVPLIRWRLFLIYLAGPASHAILLTLFYFLAQTLTPFTLARYAVNAMIWSNLVLLLINLFPHKVSAMADLRGTDGWHLLRAPFLSEKELTQHYVGNFLNEALQAYTANNFTQAKSWLDQALALDSTSVAARNMLGVLQLALGQNREARLTFIDLLETEDGKKPAMYYLLLNNIAYLDALIGDPSLFPEADEYSAKALKQLPWVAFIVGTRGTVLVEMGQLDEGIELLKKSMSLHVEKQGKAINACHLAIGEHRRGNHAAARKYLDSARLLDPKCYLIPRAEVQLVD